MRHLPGTQGAQIFAQQFPPPDLPAWGVWTTQAYNAANFTASSGTWTVTQTKWRYARVGNTLFYSFILTSTSISATPTELLIAIPGGYVGTGTGCTGHLAIFSTDNGNKGGFITVSSTQLSLQKYGGGGVDPWAASAAATTLRGDGFFEIVA